MKIKFLLPLAALLLAGCATRTYTTTTVSGPPPGPSIAEVQTMLKAHVGEAVIVNQIQNSSTRYTLTADQIIALKQAGASDAIINAMINSASKPPVAATTTTTVVEPAPYAGPYVYVDPWPWGWWGWGPYYHGGYYYYHGGYHHGGPPPPPHHHR